MHTAYALYTECAYDFQYASFCFADPVCIIMELESNGCLQEMLRRQRTAFSPNNLDSPSQASSQRQVNLTTRDLISFALHISNAMEYVASKQVLLI